MGGDWEIENVRNYAYETYLEICGVACFITTDEQL